GAGSEPRIPVLEECRRRGRSPDRSEGARGKCVQARRRNGRGLRLKSPYKRSVVWSRQKPGPESTQGPETVSARPPAIRPSGLFGRQVSVSSKLQALRA